MLACETCSFLVKHVRSLTNQSGSQRPLELKERDNQA